MGQKIKRLSGLEIDEVSLVNRPANQHGIVAIAKSQENVMGIQDAEGNEVELDELEIGDYVYDDNGTEYQWVDTGGDDGQNDDGQGYDDGQGVDDGYDDGYGEVGKAGSALATTRFGSRTAARVSGVARAAGQRNAARGREAGERLGRRGRSAGTRAGMTARSAGTSARSVGDSAKLHGMYAADAGRGAAGNAYGAARSSAAGQHVMQHQGAYRAGAGGAAAVGGFGAGRGRRGSVSHSMGDEVLESLSKSFNDDDRNEVIAKAMDYVQSVSERNEQLEQVVSDIVQDRDVEGYFELAKSYDLPVDPEQIAGIMYRASQTMPDEDVATMDRLFSSMGEVNKAYYDEIGYSGDGFQGDALSQIYAAAGGVVAKSDSGLTQEQAVTALFDANPAAYDEYEAEQRNYR
jgi:hypothetical protein